MKTQFTNIKKKLLDSSLILLLMLFYSHIFMELSFITSSRILPLVLPISFVASILSHLLLGRKLSSRERIAPILISCIVLALSFIFAAFYFDLSWDGQWYHQSAIYHISNGWNVFKEPIREFELNNASSIIHFPKGTWYYAASVYSFIGHFEAGKSINFILLFATLFLSYITLRDFNFSKGKALILSGLFILNPVVWSEVTTYLVDGVLYLYLSLYLLMVFAWFKTCNSKTMLIGFLAIAGMINVKFTGLVFFCVLALGALIYVIIYRRDVLVKFIGFHAGALIFSIVVMGYNPYLTNFTERGNPLYPIFGCEEYLSVFDETGHDANEEVETPKNIMGRNRLVRMFYANFGRPGNAPYVDGNDAELIVPFTSNVSDWDAYHFHETRVSGFGPYFSGIIICSFLLFLLLFITDKKSRWALAISSVMLFTSLLFSQHFWWPRFGPQMWLIPLVPVCFGFSHQLSKKLKYFTWGLAILIMVNGLIVLTMHMRWETRSSVELRKQLTDLKDEKIPIDIYYGWFEKSIEERLKTWKIDFSPEKSKRRIEKAEHMVLPSVVEGYPNKVLYRVQH